MKKTLISTFLFMTMMLLTQDAISADRYIGPKTGLMLLDLSGADDIIPVGAVYSHRLDKIVSNLDSSNLWLEGEFNFGLLGGDYDYNVPPFGKVSGDIDIWTLAGYVAYQHPLNKDAYLKGKVGLLYESVDVSASLGGFSASGSDTDIGLSLGLGGGFKINGRMTGEVEYTIIESDIDFLSFALKFPLE